MKAALLVLALFFSFATYATEKGPKAPKAPKAITAAVYPGGDVAFNGFKSTILNKVIRTGMAQGLPSGTYSVELRFDVDAKGAVSNVRPVSTIGFGLEQVAANQFAATGRWTPARSEGRNVKNTQTETFRFEVL